MKKSFLLYATVLVFVSCNNSKSKTDNGTSTTTTTTPTTTTAATGWSQADKDSFLSLCKGKGIQDDAADKKRKEDMCNCSLDAMQKIFSSYDEFNRIIINQSTGQPGDDKKHSDGENAMNDCGKKFESKGE